MSIDEKRDAVSFDTSDEDDRELVALGYKPSFKREFTNLATISFAFSIMGLCSSIATTFNTLFCSAVVWCWILGACMCFTLGSSIAEIVYCLAQLVPKQHRATVPRNQSEFGIQGQIAGISSTEFGLANMILAAVSVGKGKVVGLFCGLIVLHGLLNSLATRHLAHLTKGFVFVNLGATFVIIVVLLATTARSDMHPASYVFGEEVRRAAYAAPSAIFMRFRYWSHWLASEYVLVLCSGPLENLPGSSGSAFLEVYSRYACGKTGSLIIWAFVCLTAFFVVQTALHAASRTVYAFSRDHGVLRKEFQNDKTPLRAICLTTLVSILPGLLDLASPIAANAIFSLTAIALDLSYIIPIFCRRVYAKHPDVMFKPGPFYMGDGWLGWTLNVVCITWTLFVCVIFSFPTVKPVTKENMNYASVITVSVIALAFAWYILGANKFYVGPQSNLHDDSVEAVTQDAPSDEKKSAE
ncbi:APC amino acid permease [Pholiota molesta]|nr:APC amino acid permease [Pholiota molesta]